MAFAVLTGTLIAATGAGDRPDRRQAAGQTSVGSFLTHCRFSHRNADDAIVYPREPGESHDHTYIGNTSTNAFSTYESLRAAGTTCTRHGDTAAYWVPTIIENGQPLDALGATIYYRSRTSSSIRAFPAGLRMIAGDAAAMMPQGMMVTYWHCGMTGGVSRSSNVPTCPGTPGRTLRLQVNFPNCWDGTNLDSTDHKSHMAYSRGGRCPASHPVVVPAISLIVRYPSAGGPGVQLASGSSFSGHADFFNAWDQSELTRLVETCLDARVRCGRA